MKHRESMFLDSVVNARHLHKSKGTVTNKVNNNYHLPAEHYL
jgi:hypothetical protein